MYGYPIPETRDEDDDWWAKWGLGMVEAVFSAYLMPPVGEPPRHIKLRQTTGVDF